MPNWKKVVTSGSNANLNHITASGTIYASSASIGPTGTVTSSAQLTVSGSISASGEIYAGSSTTDTHQFTGSIYQVGSTAHGYPLWTIKNEGNSGEFWHFINDSGSTVVSYNQSLTGAAELSLYGSGSNPARTHRFADASSGASSWVAYSADSSSVNYFGIGTANPSAHLHVSGNIKYSGDLIPVNEAEAAGQRAAFGTTDTGSNETVTVQGNISASGNLFVHGISASGEIFLEKEKRIRFGSDDTFISSSGDVEDLWIRADDDILVEADDDIYLTAGDDIYLTYGYGNKFYLRNASNQKTIEIDDADDSITLTGNITASGDISASGTGSFSHLELAGTGDAYLEVAGDISASGDLDVVNVSGSGNLVLGGGTFTSASLAAGGGGGVSFPTTEVVSSSNALYIGNVGGAYISGSQGNLELSGSGTALLEVAGDISASGDLYLQDNQSIHFDDTSGGHEDVHIQKTDDGQLKISGSTDNSLVIDTKYGNVGIGAKPHTDSTNSGLTVSGSISASGDFYKGTNKLVLSSQTGSFASGSDVAGLLTAQPTFVLESETGSFASGSDVATNITNILNLTTKSGSWDNLTAKSGSWDGILTATSSYLQNSDTGSMGNLTVSGNISASGGLTVEGEITASGDIILGDYVSLNFNGSQNSNEIKFGDYANDDVGGITYSHEAPRDLMKFVTGAQPRLTISQSGTGGIAATRVGIGIMPASGDISKTLTVQGSISASGDYFSPGSASFGTINSSGKVLTVEGAISSSGNFYQNSGAYVVEGRTVIKILPTDFISDDDQLGVDQRAVWEDDLTNSGIRPGTVAVELFAVIDVPLGYTATKVKINGKNAVEVIVYTFDLDDGTKSSEISNTALLVKGDLDLATNHVGADDKALLIEIVTTAVDDVIYGGYVTIEPT